MKKNIRLFVLVVTLCSIQNTHSKEVGRHDGGEYCCWTSGANSGAQDYGIDTHALRDTSVPSSPDDQGDIDQTSWLQGDMNFQEVKSLFPIFNAIVHDHPLVYVDSGATAQMPHMVLDAIVDYYENYKANVGRGLYVFAERSTQMFEATRTKVAHFLGAKKQEIVFTSGATASINLIAHIWAKHHIGQGDEIVISEVEHNANFIPWRQLAEKNGAVLKIVPVNQQGVVDVEILKTYLSNKTKLVAITQQSNILGTTNDIAAIVQAAHSVGAKVLVDAAQSVAHQKIDVAQLQCDFLVFSAHKLFGPTGVGVCFIKKDLFDQCVLQNFGGGMAYSVSHEHLEFKPFPYCLEPGTQAIAQVIGLGAAIDFIWQHINFEQAQQHETELVRILSGALQQIPGITLISPIPAQGQHNNLVTFFSESCHAYDIAEYLDLHGIAARSGFHCAQPYHDKLGGHASVRVSFSVYNTEQEVEWLIACLKKLLMPA